MKNLANTLAHVEYVMGMFCILVKSTLKHAGMRRSTPSSSTNFVHEQNSPNFSYVGISWLKRQGVTAALGQHWVSLNADFLESRFSATPRFS